MCLNGMRCGFIYGLYLNLFLLLAQVVDATRFVRTSHGGVFPNTDPFFPSLINALGRQFPGIELLLFLLFIIFVFWKVQSPPPDESEKSLTQSTSNITLVSSLQLTQNRGQ